ncbi:uncharacterized protein PHALS_11543 [Plasmopara halstedii]|uniref:Uncharacterized protein n=1 Tax=Plasmopara halstedii TaxID=4781 RepID=A0A0P1AJ26_PLAHL|nr:uncharacterized protein PHALS_11543 [Plasmopara halstedii]CEG41177.1 hypothetical protein PHALS_11543 [Plasmopara halstedii]|eukprot:XP_024577546.1 hypothetical protein PHALS_11543 [Plasmopara halstedii]
MNLRAIVVGAQNWPKMPTSVRYLGIHAPIWSDSAPSSGTKWFVVLYVGQTQNWSEMPTSVRNRCAHFVHLVGLSNQPRGLVVHGIVHRNKMPTLKNTSRRIIDCYGCVHETTF